MVKGTTVVLAGEINTAADIDFENIVKRIAKKLNYDVDNIINLIGQQSKEIDDAVRGQKQLGAGDQGIMFGYACNETDSYLPFAFDIANKIIERIEEDVEHNPFIILKGDAKTQVTVDLDTNEIKKILVSICHKENRSIEIVRVYVTNLLMPLIDNTDLLMINPAGTWTIGGPMADCGLTGRKIVCDQYGGFCAVGGGAFSGKDPTKVDVSAAYMARVIACFICKKFSVEVDRVEVQLGYAIGVPEPTNICIKINGIQNKQVEDFVREEFDLTPLGIIKYLRLLDLDYEKIAEGCHYREPLGSFLDGGEIYESKSN